MRLRTARKLRKGKLGIPSTALIFHILPLDQREKAQGKSARKGEEK
jgi:hypothetical protein